MWRGDAKHLRKCSLIFFWQISLRIWRLICSCQTRINNIWLFERCPEPSLSSSVWASWLRVLLTVHVFIKHDTTFNMSDGATDCIRHQQILSQREQSVKLCKVWRCVPCRVWPGEGVSARHLPHSPPLILCRTEKLFQNTTTAVPPWTLSFTDHAQPCPRPASSTCRQTEH